jgi:hypothetical protein
LRSFHRDVLAFSDLENAWVALFGERMVLEQLFVGEESLRISQHCVEEVILLYSTHQKLSETLEVL